MIAIIYEKRVQVSFEITKALPFRSNSNINRWCFFSWGQEFFQIKTSRISDRSFIKDYGKARLQECELREITIRDSLVDDAEFVNCDLFCVTVPGSEINYRHSQIMESMKWYPTQAKELENMLVRSTSIYDYARRGLENLRGELKDYQAELDRVNASNAWMFCEICHKPDPETDRGYTTCCNEPPIPKREMLAVIQKSIKEYRSSIQHMKAFIARDKRKGEKH